MNITPDALALHDAGLCVIRARADGSKAPLGDETRKGEWRHWQTERPPRLWVSKAFATDHPAVGIVCGNVSGGLVMLELEGRAVEAGMAVELGAACKSLGCGEVWARMSNGWVEVSPSGGLHWFLRVPNPCGNVKLAMDEHGATLIETRGEGGFTVVAPSHGPTHPTGQPWRLLVGGPATIPRLSDDELALVLTACRTLHRGGHHSHTPPPTPRGEHVGIAAWNGAASTGSWMRDVVDHLEHTTDMGSVLAEYGWRHDHDAGGRSYWTRPGKDTGTSGVINEAGRLVVFSTSTPFDHYDGTGRPTSYSVLDVVAMYEHRGNAVEAARAIAERIGLFAARDRAREAFLDAQPQAPQARHNPVFAPYGDEEQGPGRLPPDFWHGQPRLEAIHDAALARLVAPTALLHVCLARIAAIAPHDLVVPPMVGSVVNLSYLTMLVGGAEAGKSSVSKVARDLLPAPATTADNLPIGSGQGLVDVLFEYVTEPDPVSGKTVRVKRQVRHNAFVYVDEGESLAALSGAGSVLLPTLRSIYSSTVLGMTGAREETRRIVPDGGAVYGVVVAIQPTRMGELFNGADVGNPQRFTYTAVTDPRIGEPDPPEFTGAIAWQPPRTGRRELHGGIMRTLLSFPPQAVALVQDARRRIARGEVESDPWSAHVNLTRCKVAGLLAVFDGRTEVGDDDWWRAGLVLAASNEVRDAARSAVAGEVARVEAANTHRIAKRNAVLSMDEHERGVERAALDIARKVRKRPGITVPELRRSFDSASAGRKHFNDGLARADERGWVVEHNSPGQGGDKRALYAGEVSP